MVNVQSEIIIHCRKIRVWEYVSDPDNAPEWYANIQSVNWKTPKPAELGTKVSFVGRFMRRTLAYIYEITEWVPLEHVTMQITKGPFPMKTIYSFRSLDEEVTRVKLRNVGGPEGASRLFTRLVAWMMKRANRRDLKRLKDILEEKYACDPRS